MYHEALIETGAFGSTGALPQLAVLVDRAIRSLEEDPPLARRCLERLSRLVGAAPAAAEAALLPERIAAPAMAAAKGGLAGWQIHRVTAYIDARLEQPLATEMLAEVVQLSTGHFCRAFKVSMGEPPHAYIMRQRIRRAQTLMLESRDSLSHIACACGLSDQAHLTRLFRRLVGTTPLLWRRAWQQAA